jgi:hypothetical protein
MVQEGMGNLPLIEQTELLTAFTNAVSSPLHTPTNTSECSEQVQAEREDHKPSSPI